MTEQNFSAIRARLRYDSVEEFMKGYAKFISAGGMFIPMAPAKLKPVGTTIRFQFLLGDGSTALLGEGAVLQVRSPDDANPKSPVGMLIKFTRLSQESKALVDRIVALKNGAQSPPESSQPRQPQHPNEPRQPNEPQHPNEPRQPVDQGGEAREDRTHEMTLDEFAAMEQARAGGGGERQPDESDATVQVDASDVASMLEGGQAQRPAEDETTAADDVAAEEGEAAPDFEPAGEPPTEEMAQETAAQNQPTREAPDDAPTAEAPAEEEPAGGERGPRRIAGTEGGLQIMAFDDVSDDDMAEFEEFAFEGAEDEIDNMFDGLFGGGGGDAEGGDFFGGGDAEGGDFFGGVEAGDQVGAEGSMPSVEFEVPPEEELEDDIADQATEEDEALSLGEAFDGEPAEEFELDEESEPAFEIEEPPVELDEESEPAFELDEEPEPALELDEESEPAFELDEEVGEAAVEPEEDVVDEMVEEELVLDDEVLLEDEGAPDEEDVVAAAGPEEETGPVASLPQREEEAEAGVTLDEPESDAVPIEPSDIEAEIEEPPPVAEEAVDVEHEQEVPQPEIPEEERPSELEGLLGSLEDDDEEEELSLNLGGPEVPGQEEEEEEEEAAPEPEDEESLESLLAHAQQDIQKKKKEEEAEEKADILDELLGDEDLPAPPGGGPVFDLDDTNKKKKKKGFISKLFGKD